MDESPLNEAEPSEEVVFFVVFEFVILKNFHR